MNSIRYQHAETGYVNVAVYEVMKAGLLLNEHTNRSVRIRLHSRPKWSRFDPFFSPNATQICYCMTMQLTKYTLNVTFLIFIRATFICCINIQYITVRLLCEQAIRKFVQL